MRKLVEFFPHTEIIIMYGLTECFRSTYLPFAELLKRPGSIGKPVPEVEIMILNEQGQPCKPGEKGELIHRGAFISYGYLNATELTENRFIKVHTGGPGCVPETAVRSGDLVSRDEEGFIYFHGRLDMQMKCAGYRVSPSEVEEAVLLFSDMSQAASFGMPDSLLGQAVYLAYSTYSKRPVEQIQLERHLSKCLPSYAIPRYLRFYTKLPLTANGKFDYAVLKHDAMAKEHASP